MDFGFINIHIHLKIKIFHSLPNLIDVNSFVTQVHLKNIIHTTIILQTHHINEYQRHKINLKKKGNESSCQYGHNLFK